MFKAANLFISKLGFILQVTPDVDVKHHCSLKCATLEPTGRVASGKRIYKTYLPGFSVCQFSYLQTLVSLPLAGRADS